MTHASILTGGPWDGLTFNLVDPTPLLVMEIKTQEGRLNSAVYRYAGTLTENNTSIYAYAEGQVDPNRAAQLFRGMESGLRPEVEKFATRIAAQEQDPTAAARTAMTMILDAILDTAKELDRRMRTATQKDSTP